MVEDPYTILGVDRKATKEQVKKAYRKRAKKAHPDKGGSNADFSALGSAYALLMDDNARAYYDRTGSTQTPNDMESTVRTRVVQLFMEIMQKNYNRELLIYKDLMELVQKEIDKQITDAKKNRKDRASVLRYVTKVQSKLKYVGNGAEQANPLLLEVLKHERAGLEAASIRLSEDILVLKRMKKYAKKYEFEPDKQPSQSTFHIGGFVYPGKVTFSFFDGGGA